MSNNWPIKLTALALATVLWVAVAAEEPTTQTIAVSLTVEPPPGRTLTRPLPPVRALYAGPARELIKLYASPPIVHRTLPDTVTDSIFTLELSTGDLEILKNANVKAQDIQPRKIVVQLDDVVRRTVPVVPRVDIRPDSGFALFGGIAVTPSSVAVIGPIALVNRIGQVQTVPLDLSGVTGPVRRLIQIDTAALGTLRVLRREVEISAEIGPMSERVLMGIPVTVRASDAGWSSDPPAVIVTVRGPTARLVRLTRDSVEVDALPLGQGARETVRLQVVAPPGIEGTALPDTVSVLRPPPSGRRSRD